ncbi:hypothetical protein DJ568_06035 [Mucilaginibacter hurinus]|uniref:Uncharacterized protein n=1 Tax=Mucilaginibacter hurinus TaxID=2201324 RepID=A0A367GPR3_9SPHI|nr:hypothetical protein [Mucilaginibacter hurinus]RCH55452.1 hypothetical protein DJ568_06035 [Mucilaginibacter hurinus]
MRNTTPQAHINTPVLLTLTAPDKGLIMPQNPRCNDVYILVNEAKSAFIFGNNRVVSETIVKIKAIAEDLGVYALTEILTDIQRLADKNASEQELEFRMVELDGMLASGMFEPDAQIKIPA